MPRGGRACGTPGQRALARRIAGCRNNKCPKGYFCLYQHFTYNLNDARGLILRTDEDISRLDDFDFNDRASSYYNNTDHFVTVYEHFFEGGDAQQFAPGDHGDLSGRWNDTVSSVKID